jgi:predicted ATPase
MSQKIVIPAKFTAHDKILRFGGKIEDPFKLNVINSHEADDRVFTSAEHQAIPEKRIKAIQQINDTFEKVKAIKVGMAKPGSNGRVTAKRVHSFIPHFQSLPLKVIQVVNDDVAALEENLPIKSEVPSTSQVGQSEAFLD